MLTGYTPEFGQHNQGYTKYKSKLYLSYLTKMSDSVRVSRSVWLMSTFMVVGI